MSWLREPNAEPIAGYRLIEPLGSGGFGEVWKCEAPGGIFKAIKFVYGNINSLDCDGTRAEQELRALQRIKEVRHPFICSLDRIEIASGELVIVMELAEKTLHDLFVECQKAGLIGIPRDNLLRYMRDSSEALDYMNEKHKLQHLDVKPRNLFVISDRVKVADFGLVKHLERSGGSGILGGVTPLYAAPETFSGKISEHTDQYSLAIVYQELLTGHRPFQGKNVRQLAHQHLTADPDLRSLPEQERPILMKALSKEPERRFSSCMSFVAALYKARMPIVVQTPAQQAAEAKKPALVGVARPKSLAETMEDFQLEEMNQSVSVQFDLPRLGQTRPLAAKIADDDDEAVDFGNLEVSQIGVTVALPETGALRPTLIIGLGSFGRKALQEIRCRFVDRFGDLNKLPVVRFLYIDTDNEAIQSGLRGAPEVVLSRAEAYHLPLQQVTNYRRRNLELLSEWLPREKLYAMPRSLQPQGSRALGRLAFADNQQRLLGRLKRDIQEITNPENVYSTVSKTGLALRDNTPRVYVLSASGGGNSGMLPDLGYGVRRLLCQLQHPDAKVQLFLFCGSPTDPATPKPELANTYATLTELNHFADPHISFAAQYGVEGQRIVDDGLPYHGIYMLPLPHRSPENLEENLAHLGNYLFHELTTPLGVRLDHLRQIDAGGQNGQVGSLPSPLRSFGTYSIWFPRGLLLRLAARHACRKLIDGWMSSDPNQVPAEGHKAIDAYLAKVNQNPLWKADNLAYKIEANAVASVGVDLGTHAAEVLTGLLGKLEEQVVQSVALEDPHSWAKQAFNRVKDFIGSGLDDAELNEWRKTKLSRSLSGSAQKCAEEWDKEIAKGLFALMEFPGARVAAAELALDKLQKIFHQAGEGVRDTLGVQEQKTRQAWTQLQEALDDCAQGGSGFRFFGGRSKSRSLRTFMEALTHFARQRLQEELYAAARHTYQGLGGRLLDRGRDLGFCRQRLRHLQENIENRHHPDDAADDITGTRPSSDFTVTRTPGVAADTLWEGLKQSATSRVVLPNGEPDLDRSARRFLQALNAEQWIALDKELHERILENRGGLNGACLNSGDLSRNLAEPMLEATGQFLSQHLPVMDVAQILGGEFGFAPSKDGKSAPPAQEELAGLTIRYLERALPLVPGKATGKHQQFLLVPASPFGKALTEGLAKVLPDLRVVTVPGQSDLLLCREQGGLTVPDIERLLKPCQTAYDAASATPTTSPHARFDIMDWSPLNP